MTPIFDPANPPILSGFFSIVKATADIAISGGSGGTVAIPIAHDWGPEGVVREITSTKEYRDLYGPTDNDNSFAVLGALEGDGSESGGASSVLVYRIAPTTPNGRATLNLSNGSATGLTLSAIYTGTYGNSLRVTIRNHPVLAGHDELRITDVNTSALLESYDYVEDDLTELVGKINAASQFVTATVAADGVALATISDAALTGGTNAAIVAADHTAAMAAIETEEFDIVVFPNLTDPTVLASARTWVQSMNDNIRNVFLFTGGGSEIVSVANTRSALTATNENVANAGVNIFVDQTTDTEYTTAQMVGFTAGICAGYGVGRSMTYGRYPERFRLKTRPTNDMMISAVNGGTLIAAQDRRGVYIVKGITTFNVNYLSEKPKDIFSRILNVRVIHRIDNDLANLVRTNFVGGTKNNPTNRATFISEVMEYFKTMEKNQILDAGSSDVWFDETQDNSGETLHLGWKSSITKSIEQVLSVGIVS